MALFEKPTRHFWANHSTPNHSRLHLAPLLETLLLSLRLDGRKHTIPSRLTSVNSNTSTCLFERGVLGRGSRLNPDCRQSADGSVTWRTAARF
jgi:hypothetical protein